ncbi:MAG: hypothetical protein ACOCQQ_03075 [Candidatus Nanoarchaeia archaeon]
MDTKQLTRFELISAIYIVILVLLILFTGFATNHNLFIILLGFLPTFLVVVFSLLIHERKVLRTGFLWLLPFIVIGAFYLLGSFSAQLAQNIDVGVLSGLNFILSLVYILSSFSLFEESQKKSYVPKPQHHIVDKEPKKSLSDYAHSIEDKSKALNFAIGRVYSQFHGGTDAMRTLLRIPKDWYNEFSFIGLGTDEVDFVKLNEIVAKFEVRLALFKKTERELFGKKVDNLKNIIHDPSGKDLVIDVLDHNDKDPVRSYYEGALDFCKKIRHAMKQKEVKLVRNEYVPKEDENVEDLRGAANSLKKAPTRHLK